MIFEQFAKTGIIPVIAPDDPKDAPRLAEILCGNGLSCAEISFVAPAAEDTIRTIAREFPDILIGAGTVLTTEQADRAMSAGANFIVSPGLNPQIVQYCIDSFIPVIPGAQTPSEMEQALDLGLKAVKFFPAEPSGGLAVIEAVSEVFPDLKFMPEGGINRKNVRDYLAHDRVIACVCGWMFRREIISSGEWDKAAALVKEAASIVKEARG